MLVLVHDEDIGAVFIEVRAQQRIQHAFLLEVDAAAHGAQVLAVFRKNRLRDKDDEVAGNRHIRLANDRAFGLQGFHNAAGGQRFACDLQCLGRCGQHIAGVVDDGDGVETLGLQAQPRGFFAQEDVVLHVPGHQLGAVVQLLQGRLQKVIRAARQLGGIGVVAVQRGVYQLLALHQIAGVEGVGKRNQGAADREHQNQAAQIQPGSAAVGIGYLR